jgi:UDP-glucuronate decarboxylase
MRILVAGGAGFVGSHICRRLIDEGHEVICVDSYQTGQRANLVDLLRDPRFEAVRHDITAPILLDADMILNLACPASPPHYQADPVRTMRTSVLGTMNLLELARSLKVPLLQASTSEVYGDPAIALQEESYWGNVNPIGIRACYDEGKRAAEALCFDYRRQYGTDVRVARIFNTYGPGMRPDDGRVVSNFIVQALRGEPLTVYGDGTQTRSFCYVSDLVEGLLRLARVAQAPDGPVNLGNPVEFTMLELAELVLEHTGSRSTVEFRPLPQDDPRQRRPDITRARTLLGWEPLVPLREGLAPTAAHFARLANAA